MSDKETIQRLERELAAALKDAVEWKRHWELYKNAWYRSLSGRLFNKRHLIDALVMTTEDLNKRVDEADRIIKQHAEDEHERLLAMTLGLPCPKCAREIRSSPTERRSVDRCRSCARTYPLSEHQCCPYCDPIVGVLDVVREEK